MMRKQARLLFAAMMGASLACTALAADEGAKKEEVKAPAPLFFDKPKEESKGMTGKQIAYDRRLGNCLACHAMPSQADAEMPGTIAPPLISMKARYPDKAKLRAQIWDATVANPKTSMPPFGKHKILTEEEIDKVADFVYSL